MTHSGQPSDKAGQQVTHSASTRAFQPPEISQVETAALACVPPGQQEVGHTQRVAGVGANHLQRPHQAGVFGGRDPVAMGDRRLVQVERAVRMRLQFAEICIGNGISHAKHLCGASGQDMPAADLGQALLVDLV